MLSNRQFQYLSSVTHSHFNIIWYAWVCVCVMYQISCFLFKTITSWILLRLLTKKKCTSLQLGKKETNKPMCSFSYKQIKIQGFCISLWVCLHSPNSSCFYSHFFRVCCACYFFLLCNKCRQMPINTNIHSKNTKISYLFLRTFRCVCIGPLDALAW